MHVSVVVRPAPPRVLARWSLMIFGGFHFLEMAGCIWLAGTQLKGEFQLDDGLLASPSHGERLGHVAMSIKGIGVLFDSGVKFPQGLFLLSGISKRVGEKTAGLVGIGL